MRKVLLEDNYLTEEEKDWIIEEEFISKFKCLPSQLYKENAKKISMICYVGSIKDSKNPERRMMM